MNCTGRVFMCLGHDPEDEMECNDLLIIGSEYREAKLDRDGINLAEGDEDYMLLHIEPVGTLYVPARDFAFMPEASDKLKQSIDG